MDCVFVGAGAVAKKYAQQFDEHTLTLAAVCDLDADRAGALATANDATAYTDVDAMLAAESVPLVVNLTSHGAHADVTARCLQADRHVFSEKPLALDADRARELLATAARRGLALGCAPINPYCDAQRHAAGLIGDGRLGPIQLGYAHAHVGRVTEWHDDPDSFLQVGPLYDGAVYPLSLLLSWFGPVERVRVADAVDIWPEREAKKPARAPHIETTLAFADGPVVRLTASFYAPHRSREFNSLELHGDDGSLYLADSGALAAERDTVQVGGSGRPYVAAPHPSPPQARNYLSGPERLAEAIRRGNRPDAGARRGAHVVAICNAIEAAAETGESVAVADCGVTKTAPTAPPIRPHSSPGNEGTARASARNAAIRLPPIGFGCSRYRDGEYVDRISSVATALDAGYRLLDSAELYGNESRIGDLLGSPGAPGREGIFLVSKVWNTNHGHVTEACEGSLAELGVDTLDCYMLHWPDSWAYQGPLRELAARPPAEQESLTFPTDEDGERATEPVSLPTAWRQLEELHDRGLTRTLGLCNVSLPELTTVAATARVMPAVVQVESHPYLPQMALVEACHDRGIRVMAHSPLSAPGLLEEPVLQEIGENHGVGPAAVVVAWQVQRGVVPIPASNDTEHIVDNLAAARLRLSPAERAQVAGLAGPDFER